MVSEPLLWPFLSSLIFIGVTQFSTYLPPSQQPSQPLAIEPLTSSNHRPWVPDLLLLSLSSFTPQRTLPFASPPWILLLLIFYKYHWDRLALMYRLMEASKPSKTARSPTSRSKVLSCNLRAPRTSMHHCTSGLYFHVLPRAASSGHMPSRTLTRLNTPADIILLRQP